MWNEPVTVRVNKKGLTLVEILIALLISAVILTVIISLYTTSARTFQKVKNVSDVKEIGKFGAAQLEWLFQRWGTSTPCNNAVDADQCTQVHDCREKKDDVFINAYPYPPRSSVCITIVDKTANNEPCDEAYFYANLYGNGFVYIPDVSDSQKMHLTSCQLTGENPKNCYHIKMGARFILDQTDPNAYNPLVFRLKSLSEDNLSCTEGSIEPNATVSSFAEAVNGNLGTGISGKVINNYTLEGGEVILRVPHRIKLFCQKNSQDQDKLWLYMDAEDMGSFIVDKEEKGCAFGERAQALIPVNSFDIQKQGDGVVVTMQVRGADGKVINMQRYFGR